MVDSSMFAGGWPGSGRPFLVVCVGILILAGLLGTLVYSAMKTYHAAGVCEGRGGKIVEGVCCKVTPLDGK